jgi:tRNA wybutosine-synthesizing protein 3
MDKGVKMHENQSGFEKKRFAMVKEHHKKTLEKAIAEKKADELIIPLCRFIASTKDFFTASSCSGRILLLELQKGECKKDSNFHRKWHCEVSFKELLEGLKAKTSGIVWLKAESFILHIGCPDLESAKKILKIMKESGVKRGGIIVASKGKFIIELVGTQALSVPVKEGEKILVDEQYLKYLLKACNKKIRKNYEKLKRFEKNVRKELAAEK